MESSALELLSRAALNVQEHEGECHAKRFVAQISISDFVIRSSGIEQIASEEEASLAAQAAATERHTEPSTTDSV